MISEPSVWLTALVLSVVLIFSGQYLLGRMRQRVCAWGRDTYVRFYPNPGVGFRAGQRRVALSIVGGLEVFKIRLVRDGHTWIRTYAALSRVKRPGGRA